MRRIVNAILLYVVVGLLTLPPAVLADKPVITVSTVEQLYEAVNDTANMNVVVQLTANTYFLDDSAERSVRDR